MDKKTYTLIGIAGVGLLALYVWSKGKQKKNFVAKTAPVGPNYPIYMPRGCVTPTFLVAGSGTGKCKIACEDRDGFIIFPSGNTEIPCPE